MSGKTFFTRKLIEHRAEMFKVPPSKVVYAYGAWQQAFDSMEKSGVEFYQGVPKEEEMERWSESGDHVLLILDDVMRSACASPEIMKLFTVNCHHRNLSVAFLSQNIFPPGVHARTISLNSSYIIVFMSKRDKLQVQTLGKQIFPNRPKYFAESYEDATRERWGYLLCDLHPATDPEFQLRTGIFPGEQTVFYTPLKEGVEPETRSFTVETS